VTMLIVAAAAFLAIHIFISGTRLRDQITAAIGEGPYTGLFSLASLGTIIWLVIAFNKANGGPDDRILFNLGPGIRHLAIPIVAMASAQTPWFDCGYFLCRRGLPVPRPPALCN